MEFDKTAKLSNSIIQHGNYNDRVYLMKLSESDDKKQTIEQIIGLAKKNNYGKVFAKIKAKDKKIFEDYNFESEARIPRFFNGDEDSEFYSLFISQERRQVDLEQIRENLNLALDKKRFSTTSYDHHVVELKKENVTSITEAYSKIFETYPFPIFDNDFITDCLEKNVRIFAIIGERQIIALSSCEIDDENKNVEMTDFATLPNHRGKGLAQALLIRMEAEMKEMGMKTAYTIARALSPGMNITFSKSGYTFGGTLKKNTNISGGIQSMNVWYKNLKE
jgi:putative beta-lysine N-acetyltransferase